MKQTVTFNFSKGLDTKSDSWQVQLGSFQNLQNSIFQKGGLLQKRNGYGLLSSSNPTSNYLTTLNGNLLSIGSTVNAYSSSLGSWVTKGNLKPCSLQTLALIRNNLNQIQADSVVSGGLVLTVYTQVSTTFNSTTSSYNTYQFAIADAQTGQNIVAPTLMPVLATGNINGSSRVTVVGNYFVIVSPVLVGSTTFLQYCSIPVNLPLTSAGTVNISAAQNTYPEAYNPITSNPGWDIAVTNNTLVVAYNSTAGGQGIHVISLTASQIAANSAASFVHTFTNAAYIGALVSVCVDLTTNPNLIYISFWNNSTNNGYTCAVFLGLGTITNQFTPLQIITSIVISNLTSAAQNGFSMVFSEVVNAYSYDANVPSSYINGVIVSVGGGGGSVGSPYAVVRSVGLASKAFVDNGKIYFLAAYQSPYQNTYFLINGSSSGSSAPLIVAKLAYQNGGGYLAYGLPSVTLSENIAQIAYLFKDSVEALNVNTSTQQTQTGGIYSQTGINLVSFDIGTTTIDTAEIGQSLNISGGYLGMFDGYLPVEQNFFLFPDSVEVTWLQNSVVTPTGTFANASTSVTVSSTTGISVGMSITDTSNAAYIPAGTFVTAINGSVLTISKATTHAGTADNLSIQGNIQSVPTGGAAGLGAYYYQVTYEWTDNNGIPHRSAPSIAVPVTTTGAVTTGTITINVPTLRLTAKVSNPVKIVIYRWSTNTQVYNQVTSITVPVMNSTTTDSISFVDTLPDTSVVGNNIIYTTGGVVPNTNAPSSSIMTLFDTRLWLVDAENPNVLWISKQVIAATPVETSSLFTIYVAPNTGTVASTGPMTALAPMDDKIILFKENSIYYINGVGPNNLGTTASGCSLGNYSQPIFITSVVGCTNQQSIVLTQDGLMFQSDKGIWLLGRNLQTSYIGAPVESFNSYSVTSANVIPKTNYVLFTLQNGPILMYDYYYSQWGTFSGYYGQSSTVYNDLHTVLTPYGQILQETPGLYLDDTSPVLMSFTSSWLNLASLQGYERFYEFSLLARYLSPHLLNCQVAYDYNTSILHQVVIHPKNFSSATPSAFGIPTPFGAPADPEQWRIHAKMQLCESFQLTISEIYDASLGAVAGGGFTMSGISCVVSIKGSKRPYAGSVSAGMS